MATPPPGAAFRATLHDMRFAPKTTIQASAQDEENRVNLKIRQFAQRIFNGVAIAAAETALCQPFDKSAARMVAEPASKRVWSLSAFVRSCIQFKPSAIPSLYQGSSTTIIKQAAGLSSVMVCKPLISDLLQGQVEGGIAHESLVGGSCGAVQAVVQGPFSTLNQRQMAAEKPIPIATLIKEVPLRDLQKGVAASAFRNGLMWAPYLNLRELLKEKYNFSHPIAGAVAGILTSLQGTPIDTIIRKQRHEGLGIKHAIQSLYRERGLLIFWRALPLTAPRMGIAGLLYHLGLEFQEEKRERL